MTNIFYELLTFRNISAGFAFSMELCWIQGRCLERLQRRESCIHEAFEFFVQAEAGEDVDAGRRVGAGEKRDAGFVHRVDDFPLLLDETLARGQASSLNSCSTWLS